MEVVSRRMKGSSLKGKIDLTANQGSMTEAILGVVVIRETESQGMEIRTGLPKEKSYRVLDDRIAKMVTKSERGMSTRLLKESMEGKADQHARTSITE